MASAARSKLAGVVTTCFKYSHAQHIIDRFLDGYGWNSVQPPVFAELAFNAPVCRTW
jgi:hypothetical protein